jgi:LCP family protein required for cell wall assembly
MSDRSPTPFRPAHPRARRTFLAASAAVAALVMVLGAVGMGAYAWTNAQRRVLGNDTLEVSGSPAPEQKDILGKCAEGPCNYLLLGSDSREGLTPEEQVAFGTDEDIGGENRSDTIILVHTRPGQKEAVFLSFPRDLWVEIPGVGMGRINSAFEGGIDGNGAPRVARTVRDLTGMPIHHVMYVSLAGFQGLVDALGGVDMCVPYPMVDELTGLDIEAGCQRFDGATALAYVRTRHQPCDDIPDFARISRQQQFLRAVISEMLSPGRLIDLPTLVPELLDNLVVDDGLNVADLVYLAGTLQGVGTERADFRTVPTVPGWEGELSVVRMVQPAADDLFRRIREGRPLGELGTELLQTAPSPANIGTAVYDLGGAPAAPEVLEVLTEGGFLVAPEVQDGAAIDPPGSGSAIVFSGDDDEMAAVVRTYFPNMEVVSVPPRAMPGDEDVAIVVGGNYRLPEAPAQSPAAVECPA